jgi:endonuclease I
MKLNVNLRFLLTCLIVFGGLGPRSSWANDTDYAPPPGYYDSAAGLTGSALQAQLTTIMTSGFVGRSYGDYRYAAAVIDADPNHAGNILLLYNRASVSGAWDLGVTWNREHQWPVSLLGTSDPSNTTINMETDEFYLRPTNPSVNSSRGNSPYGTVSSSGANGFQTPGYYYVGDADRGDVARAMFYIVTRYPSFNGHTLALVNGSPITYQMGDLNSFLHWNYADVPDAFELRRNQAVYSSTLNPTYYQGNRNAFIDHPEFVWSVFVNQANDTSITTSTNAADLGRLLVGSSFGTRAITINKTGNSGTYYEVRTSGVATSTVSGHYNAFAMDGPGSVVTTVGLSVSTTAAGLKSGTVTVHNLDITTQGGTGKGANDPDDVVTVSGAVLDHAAPSFTDLSTTRALALDFGTLAQNSGKHEATFDLFNQMQTGGYTARLGLVSIAFSGNSSAISSTLGTFTNLDAGSHRTFSVFLDTTQPGGFSGAYLLTCADENLPGAQTFSPLTLTVVGTVGAASLPPPPPLTIQGSGNQFTVSWPTNAFRLETKFNIAPSASWQTISNGLATNGQVCTFTLTNSADIQQQFFRLAFP